MNLFLIVWLGIGLAVGVVLYRATASKIAKISLVVLGIFQVISLVSGGSRNFSVDTDLGQLPDPWVKDHTLTVNREFFAVTFNGLACSACKVLNSNDKNLVFTADSASFALTPKKAVLGSPYKLNYVSGGVYVGSKNDNGDPVPHCYSGILEKGEDIIAVRATKIRLEIGNSQDCETL